MKLIFKGATVVSGRNQKVRDVFVDGGKIVEVFAESEAERIIDGRGKFLLPGVIDGHVHFREPGMSEKADWDHESKAAAAGGVTTVLDMPNTDPPTVNGAALAGKRKLVRGHSFVNYGFFAGVKEDLKPLESMPGVVGIKVYMGQSTGGLLTDDDAELEKIFVWAKKKNLPVVVHAEDEHRLEARKAQFEGHEDPVDYARYRDVETARLATERALKLRKKVGNRLHVAHVSTKAELELLREFKHPDVSCEVAPHHLLFTMEDMEDAFLKVNPPLRTIVDVEALWRALLDGTVTCLATDHAPHTAEEKRADFWKAPAGLPGVQFLLPLMLNAVNEGKLSLERLVVLACEGPARVFGLSKKGKVEAGMDADLVLVDMDTTRGVEAEEVLSKCGWTPYEFLNLKGWPVLTMVNGEVVLEKGTIAQKPLGQELF